MPDYNHEYLFRVYSRRWGHRDVYRIKMTQTGWCIENLAINGECQPNGTPFLYANFRQDYIQYPSGIGDYLESIWSRAHEEDLSTERIQEMLQALADWVSITEENAPGGIYE